MSSLSEATGIIQCSCALLHRSDGFKSDAHTHNEDNDNESYQVIHFL